MVKRRVVLMKYISVVVPEEVDRELRFACADQATTKSRLVRKLIEDYLEEWKFKFESSGSHIATENGNQDKPNNQVIR